MLELSCDPYLVVGGASSLRREIIQEKGIELVFTVTEDPTLFWIPDINGAKWVPLEIGPQTPATKVRRLLHWAVSLYVRMGMPRTLIHGLTTHGDALLLCILLGWCGRAGSSIRPMIQMIWDWCCGYVDVSARHWPILLDVGPDNLCVTDT